MLIQFSSVSVNFISCADRLYIQCIYAHTQTPLNTQNKIVLFYIPHITSAQLEMSINIYTHFADLHWKLNIETGPLYIFVLYCVNMFVLIL